MKAENKKIHVVGINSYKFEELPSSIQRLFFKRNVFSLKSSFNKYMI